MPAVTYTQQQKRQAIALASVTGADEAGKRLGIDPRTVTAWSQQAGKRPELEGDEADWEELYQLARGQIVEDVVAGKVKGNALTILAGIAADKLRRARSTPKAPPVDPVDAATVALEAWMERVRPEVGIDKAYILWLSEGDYGGVVPDLEAWLPTMDPADVEARHAEREAAYMAEVDVLRSKAWARFTYSPETMELLRRAEQELSQ